MAALLFGEGAPDMPAAVGIPHAHPLPAAGGHSEVEDGIGVGLEQLYGIGIDPALGVQSSQQGADVLVEQSSPSIGAPEAGVGSFDLFFPEADCLAGKVRIGGHHLASGGTGGIGCLVVEDDLHFEAFGLFNHPAHKAEIFVCQIADSAREADAGVGQNAPEAGLVEGVELANELLFVQVVVPEPNGDRAEFAGRVLEEGKRAVQIQDTTPAGRRGRSGQ